jgi:pimeloyl-ACP methyl ester carboxylesterase
LAWCVFIGFFLAAPRHLDAQPAPAASTTVVSVQDRRLVFHVRPGHSPILVLDAVGGADSSYWDSILPELARRTGSEIITYDRVGTGESSETKPPFKMEDAVDDLEAGLQQLGATHDLVLMPASFAGGIATYLATRHPDWVSGAIMIDAEVPDFFTDEELDRQARQIRSQAAAMLAASPSKPVRWMAAYARVFVPVNRAFHAVAWPNGIPCVVIVSEQTPFPPGLDARRWRRAEAEFASRAANRKLLVAKRSSHDVAHSRPDVIFNAAVEMAAALTP